jgi:hypothetical protein
LLYADMGSRADKKSLLIVENASVHSIVAFASDLGETVWAFVILETGDDGRLCC